MSEALTALQWMAPELARGGFLKNEDWIPEHCSRAVRLVSNQGLHVAATLMASLHPRAVDYIEQAPALILAACGGKRLHKVAERSALARRFGALCDKGPKLKEVLAHYGLVPQHRALKGTALAPSRWPVVKRLSQITPSTLAQIIPDNGFDQSEWLRELTTWADHMERRAGDKWRHFDWAAQRLSRERKHSLVHHGVTDIADLAAAHGETFNPLWSFDQAKAAAERWHRKLAEMNHQERFFATHGLGWNDPINYGSLPVDTKIDELQILAVQSGADIYAEGAAMHHCVGSYVDAVVKNRSRIFSVRQDGKRLATVELIRSERSWKAVQIKGPCNRDVPQVIERAVMKFVTIANEAKP